MFSIASIKADNRIIAAPLAGVSDRAFRILGALYGCGLAVGEMISDKGLCYRQAKTLSLLDNTGVPIPVIIQLFGSDPVYLAQAAAIAAEHGAPGIDINMGCPVPKVVKEGEGSALLLDLPACRKIIASVVKAVNIPVTVKIRSGWDEQRLVYQELGRIAEGEGAAAVTLHPRTREQFFSGLSRWEHIRILKQTISIPVIGNGDIWTPDDACRMVRETGCDAVMIGRGALGNPFLFGRAAALLEEGRITDEPDVEQRLQAARQHLALVLKCKPEIVAVKEMRKHIAWYVKGMRGAARLREMINRASTEKEMLDILDGISLDHSMTKELTEGDETHYEREPGIFPA